MPSGPPAGAVLRAFITHVTAGNCWDETYHSLKLFSGSPQLQATALRVRSSACLFARFAFGDSMRRLALGPMEVFRREPPATPFAPM